MEGGDSIYCLLYIGGMLGDIVDGKVVYNGGRQIGVTLNRSSTLSDLKSIAFERTERTRTELNFFYNVPYDPSAIASLETNDDFKTMLAHIERWVRIYAIENNEPPPIHNREHIELASSNNMVGASTSIEQSNEPTQHVLAQSIGFRSNFTTSHSEPLDCTRFENAIIGSGQTFHSAGEFRDALYLMSLAGRFKLTMKRNCKKQITAVCAVTGCPWKITGRSVGDTGVVQVFTFRNEHSHTVEDMSYSQPAIRTTRASHLIDPIIRASPDYTPRQLCKDFDRQYGIRLSYAQAWQYKERAKERIHGLPQDSYKYLPWLCGRLIQTNPGSVAVYHCSEHGHFHQLFVSLAVSIQGFRLGCHPIIAIDSSHMSGPYQGALFSALAYDADDGLFPIAYGVFTSENYEDWLWFLQKVQHVIDNREVVIISDRHPGLLRAVSEVFGSENHVHCYRHVKENFSQFLTKKHTPGRKGKSNALEMLDAIAYARIDSEYEAALGTLQLFNPMLSKWVKENSPEHWCQSKFKKMRWGKMSSNLAESFNAWLRDERHHNLEVFFHEHIDKLGTLLVNHRDAIYNWNGNIGPRTYEKVIANIAKGETYPTCVYLGTAIKVCCGNTILEVDLKEHTCTCRGWQLVGIPCDHACAAIRRIGLDVEDFIDNFYKRPMQELIYSGRMGALVNHDMPTVGPDDNVYMQDGSFVPTIKPPRTKRPPGRPRKRRIESQFQNKRSLHCSRCHESGHNRSTCKTPLA